MTRDDFFEIAEKLTKSSEELKEEGIAFSLLAANERKGDFVNIASGYEEELIALHILALIDIYKKMTSKEMSFNSFVEAVSKTLLTGYYTKKGKK